MMTNSTAMEEAVQQDSRQFADEGACCRLCLSTNGDMQALFEEDYDNSLLQQIYDCTGVEITPILGIKSSVCEFCKFKLDLFYNFKVQCEKSEVSIRTKFAKEYEVDVRNPDPDNRLADAMNQRQSDESHESVSVKSNEEPPKFEESSTLKPNGEAKDTNPDQGQKKRGRPSHNMFGRKSFKCDHCDSSFDFQSHLTMHENIHTGAKPYECQYCQKCFSQSSNLNAHLKIHTKPYKCQNCKRSYMDLNSLAMHQRTHMADKPFVCEFCDLKFAYSSQLQVHIMAHTGESPYSCQHCEQKFTCRGFLNQHLQTHLEMKRYKCDYCEKSFSFQSHLSVHTKTHTGQKPHKCSLCGKCFTQVSNLNVHMRKHDEHEQRHFQEVNASRNEQLTVQTVDSSRPPYGANGEQNPYCVVIPLPIPSSEENKYRITDPTYRGTSDNYSGSEPYPTPHSSFGSMPPYVVKQEPELDIDVN